MFLFIQIGNHIERRLEEALSQVGLSLPKYGALTQLMKAGEPLPLSELAAQMTCVRSNITQLVDRLEADGLVLRVEDPKDRRSIRAAVTKLGRERQAAGARRVGAIKDEVAKAFSEVDSKTLKQGLDLLK
ncbi:MAG: MarR family transcriptional regulator [Nitrospirae bacterium]|nr:MarR family transcriptional regulator [Candidatus Manganitrophaceae bacterium]